MITLTQIFWEALKMTRLRWTFQIHWSSSSISSKLKRHLDFRMKSVRMNSNSRKMTHQDWSWIKASNQPRSYSLMSFRLSSMNLVEPLVCSQFAYVNFIKSKDSSITNLMIISKYGKQYSTSLRSWASSFLVCHIEKQRMHWRSITSHAYYS